MSFEEQEDFGIGVDYDQCSDETYFYSQSCTGRSLSQDMKNGRISRADSAVDLNSATRDPFPAILQKFNGTRKNNKLRSFHIMTIKRAQNIQFEMKEGRKKIDSYLLTSERLSTHIIDFMDLPLKMNTRRRVYVDRVEQPLYSMSGTALNINRDFFFPQESPFAKIQMSYLRTLVETLIRYNRKLAEICDFVEQIGERSRLTLPRLIIVFYQWCKEFLRDYTIRLDHLRGKRMADPIQVVGALQQICEDCEVVWTVICADVNREAWIWEDTETSWNRLFLIMEQEAAVKKRDIIHRLQEKSFCMLFHIMDHIVEFGKVPSDVNYFVFHRDAKIDTDLLMCRDISTHPSLLWTKELVTIVLEIAKCRKLLGSVDFSENMFSKTYWRILEEQKFENEMLSFSRFRLIFVETCNMINYQLADEIFAKLHNDNNFFNLWTDLENVVIGTISEWYARTVFRSDSSVNNFSNTFWLASRGRMHRENISKFSWIDNKSEFSCKLDPLLASFINRDIIDVMNQCMRFAHSAYRTRELLITMANDKLLLSRMTHPDSNLNISVKKDMEPLTRALRARLRFFVYSLEQIVSHFRELFVDKVQCVFRNKKKEILNACRLRDIELAVKEGHSQLAALVERSGFRKIVHEAMDMFKILTDEIRLRSVSNTLDLGFLEKCESQVRDMILRLCNLGKKWQNDKDSLFFHLSVRLGMLDSLM